MDKYLLLDYIRATTSLYGIVSPQRIVKIYNEQNEDNIDPEDLVQFTDMTGEFFEYFEGSFVHEAVFLGDGFFQLKADQAGKPYYVPPKEELLRYADGSYMEKPEEYQQLYEYIADSIVSVPEVVDGLMGDIQLACALDFSIESVLDEFLRRHITFENDTHIMDTARLTIDLANNTRIWENRGHTPNEILGLVETAAFRPFPKSRIQDSNYMPLLGNIPGEAPKKNGRNDPCPCGSGRKYKKCCIGGPYPGVKHWSYDEVDAMYGNSV